MRCVITGCALIVHGKWVSGDLFDVGECYVFNANFRDGLVEWITGDPFYSRRLEPLDWWERRGVFVIRKSEANLNEAATEYIGS